jgi:hypothetical protein
MYMVVAESRLTNTVLYVSSPLPHLVANELASALRTHSQLRVLIEPIPAVQTGELQPRSDAN